MASIISKVTELDKQMREKVKKLEEDKDKLPFFLREQKKKLLKQYQSEAKGKVENRKKEIEIELNKTRKRADKELSEAVIKLQKIYNEKKDDWLKKIYNECIEIFMEE